jgi:hypothetical protein
MQRLPRSAVLVLCILAGTVLVVSVLSTALRFDKAAVKTVTGGGNVAIAKPDPLRCSWYTPMTGSAHGQTVTVTATGSDCKTHALIAWIARESNKPWATTSLANGTLIAQVTRDGTVVQIRQSGFATVTMDTAGGLADAFETAGWTVQVPTGPQGPTPFITYSSGG